MIKMTKNVMRELLKEENYIDALALVVNKVAKFKTFEGQDAERERIYNKLMGWASEFNDEADEDVVEQPKPKKEEKPKAKYEHLSLFDINEM